MNVTVMGLDPASTRNMGMAIMEFNKSGKMKIIHTETVRFPDCSCDGERLNMCYQIINDNLKKYDISKVCIERSMGMGKVFVRNNLIEMTASIKMSAYDSSIALVEISPSHLKKVITGNGRANKTLLQRHIKEYFIKQLKDDETKRSEHEWDALGLIMCGAIDEDIVKYVPSEII
jgi:crossover junction endodeoxyribonuclease RuvC